MTDISKALRELLLARAAGQIDAEEFERRQAALHAELLVNDANASHRRWWLLGGSVAVVALAILGYFWKVSQPAVAPVVAPPPMMSAMPPSPMGMPPATAQQSPNGGDLKTMAVRLAEKLAKDPTNGEGWALLGQTYIELRQYKEADQAFARADGLGKMDARLREEWSKAKAGMAGTRPAP